MKKYLRGLGFYLVLFLIIITIFVLTSMPETKATYVYSDLLNMVRTGQIKELQVVDTDAYVTLNDNTKISIVTPGYGAIYASVGEDIERQITAGTLKVATPVPASPPWWLSFLPSLGLIIIMLIFWFVMMKQSQGGGPGGAMSFGKSRAKLVNNEKNKKTFDDVAGEDEEKEEKRQRRPRKAVNKK